VNDKIGHETGDQLLKDMAGAIRQAAEEVGAGDRVFRYGGDEFVALAPKEVAEQLAERATAIYGAREYGGIKAGIHGGAGDTFATADAAMRSLKAASKVAEPPAQREFLNIGKFNSESSPLGQTLNARIRANVERLRESGDAEKGYQSFETQQAKANEYAKKIVANPLDLDQAKLKNLSGAEVVGLHQVVNENTALIESTSRAIAQGLDGEELTNALRVLDEAQRSTDEALSVIVREKAQTARDLGFFRQVAKNTTDPDVWMVQAKRILGDKPLPDKVMIEIRRLAREASEACS
jgi:predicted signal transduction protein with EAL and GGDEF domain